jgi:hypothetical protein
LYTELLWWATNGFELVRKWDASGLEGTNGGGNFGGAEFGCGEYYTNGRLLALLKVGILVHICDLFCNTTTSYGIMKWNILKFISLYMTAYLRVLID